MTRQPLDLEPLRSVAIEAAVEAGEMIARSRPTEIGHKPAAASPASQVVTDIDRRAEAMIIDRLEASRRRLGLGLLTEERPDDGSRFRAEAFWCIDPLDGTLPFVEGRPGSAVSIALVGRDGTPLIGVVYDLSTSRLLHAVTGGGLVVDGAPWSRPAHGESLVVYADRSLVADGRRESMASAFDRVARDLGLDGAELRLGAGAVMNACGVLDTRPACYLKFPVSVGGGSLWDFAATACLVDVAGAVAADLAGAALDLNRRDSTFLNHRGVLFATDSTVAERLRTLSDPSR